MVEKTDLPLMNTSFSITKILKILQNVTQESGYDVNNLMKFCYKDIAAGNAFLSKLIKIDFLWNENKKLVDSIIFKSVSSQNCIDFLENNCQSPQDEDMRKWLRIFVRIQHLHEVEFYRIVSKWNASLKIPKFYYGLTIDERDLDGLILIEDLSNRAKTVKMIPGLTNEQVENVIDELAMINATSWKHPEWFEFMRKQISDPEIKKLWEDQLGEMKTYAMELKNIRPEIFTDLMDRAEKLFTKEVWDMCVYTEEKFGLPSSLVHKDLWAPNILFEIDENDNASSKVAAIIDWQSAVSGNPCTDIARLLGMNTTTAYRRQNTDRLLRRYIEKIGDVHGNVPFSFEQLKEAYNASLGFTMMFNAMGTPMYYNMSSIIEGLNPEAIREELLTRTRAFIEDTLVVFGL